MTGLHFWVARYCVSRWGWMKPACGSKSENKKRLSNNRASSNSINFIKPQGAFLMCEPPAGASGHERPLRRGLLKYHSLWSWLVIHSAKQFERGTGEWTDSI
jgi:hypothetical protein